MTERNLLFWVTQVIALLVYSGPLLPTILVVFIKSIRGDKQTTVVLVIQWVIHLLVFGYAIYQSEYNLADVEIFYFFLLSGLLVLIFDAIYVPIRLLKLRARG